MELLSFIGNDKVFVGLFNTEENHLIQIGWFFLRGSAFYDGTFFSMHFFQFCFHEQPFKPFMYNVETWSDII